jgi:voltage-gated potassium channel
VKDKRSLRGRGISTWRQVRASWRDTTLLLREFAWPLFFFTLAIVGGGIIYFILSARAGEPIDSLIESIYVILAMTFLQPVGAFPDVWYLQIFYFLMPIIGIGILARGLADFGSMFFNRQGRSKEWEMAVASTVQNHIVLIGLGHLGFRVARELHGLDQEVVVVELDPKAELIAAAHSMDIPVIPDDGKRVEALTGAGIAKARAIVLCTQNDNLNLQIAFKARKLNPDIQVIIRIFDDDFADTLEEKFGFQTMSATRIAAPRFAAAAASVLTSPE